MTTPEEEKDKKEVVPPTEEVKELKVPPGGDSPPTVDPKTAETPTSSSETPITEKTVLNNDDGWGGSSRLQDIIKYSEVLVGQAQEIWKKLPKIEDIEVYDITVKTPKTLAFQAKTLAEYQAEADKNKLTAGTGEIPSSGQPGQPISDTFRQLLTDAITEQESGWGL